MEILRKIQYVWKMQPIEICKVLWLSQTFGLLIPEFTIDMEFYI